MSEGYKNWLSRNKLELAIKYQHDVYRFRFPTAGGWTGTGTRFARGDDGSWLMVDGTMAFDELWPEPLELSQN